MNKSYANIYGEVCKNILLKDIVEEKTHLLESLDLIFLRIYMYWLLYMLCKSIFSNNCKHIWWDVMEERKTLKRTMIYVSDKSVTNKPHLLWCPCISDSLSQLHWCIPITQSLTLLLTEANIVNVTLWCDMPSKALLDVRNCWPCILNENERPHVNVL